MAILVANICFCILIYFIILKSCLLSLILAYIFLYTYKKQKGYQLTLHNDIKDSLLPVINNFIFIKHIFMIARFSKLEKYDFSYI